MRTIESGGAEAIYGDPRHPYTLGLLGSVPRLDEPMGAQLNPIEGVPPDLIDLPQGCSFADRCQFAIDRCTAETPPLASIDDGHQSACWRSAELPEIAHAAS